MNPKMTDFNDPGTHIFPQILISVTKMKQVWFRRLTSQECMGCRLPLRQIAFYNLMVNDAMIMSVTQPSLSIGRL